MDQWEYATLKVGIHELGAEDLVQRLNARGAEGWRLVTSVVQERHGFSHDVHLVFVRALAGSGAPHR